MATHFSNGIGKLYSKEADEPVAETKYQLTETDATKYTRKRWWGELYTDRKIKLRGTFTIEFEDKRRGECVLSMDTQVGRGQFARYYYHFNGRGSLSKNMSKRS